MRISSVANGFSCFAFAEVPVEEGSLLFNDEETERFKLEDTRPVPGPGLISMANAERLSHEFGDNLILGRGKCKVKIHLLHNRNLSHEKITFCLMIL